MSTFQFISTSRQGGVARIDIARPPLNVLDIPTMEEFNVALDAVLADQADLQVLVIGAQGEKAFSAGVDVADHTPEKMDRMIGAFHGIFLRLDKMQIPVIAAVKGAALGGGCELALFCDMIVASDTLKIGQPEIKVGVFPPVAAVVLPRVIPEKKAFELLVGGEVIRADEAKACGLVNQVFPLAEFDASFEKFLKIFTSLSGSVMKETKKAIRAAKGLSFPDALHKVEGLYLNDMMKTADAKEGLAAFLEKRAPVWTHR